MCTPTSPSNAIAYANDIAILLNKVLSAKKWAAYDIETTKT